MIDGSEKRNRQLAFELQNSHVCEKRSNKSFVDQACSVKAAGYWPRSFCIVIVLDSVSFHKNAEKNLANIQSA